MADHNNNPNFNNNNNNNPTNNLPLLPFDDPSSSLSSSSSFQPVDHQPVMVDTNTILNTNYNFNFDYYNPTNFPLSPFDPTWIPINQDLSVDDYVIEEPILVENMPLQEVNNNNNNTSPLVVFSSSPSWPPTLPPHQQDHPPHQQFDSTNLGALSVFAPTTSSFSKPVVNEHAQQPWPQARSNWAKGILNPLSVVSNTANLRNQIIDTVEKHKIQGQEGTVERSSSHHNRVRLEVIDISDDDDEQGPNYGNDTTTSNYYEAQLQQFRKRFPNNPFSTTSRKNPLPSPKINPLSRVIKKPALGGPPLPPRTTTSQPHRAAAAGVVAPILPAPSKRHDWVQSSSRRNWPKISNEAARTSGSATVGDQSRHDHSHRQDPSQQVHIPSYMELAENPTKYMELGITADGNIMHSHSYYQPRDAYVIYPRTGGPPFLLPRVQMEEIIATVSARVKAATSSSHPRIHHPAGSSSSSPPPLPTPPATQPGGATSSSSGGGVEDGGKLLDKEELLIYEDDDLDADWPEDKDDWI